MGSVERLLQWNICALVVLGAMLLGIGNEQYQLPAIAAAGAFVSLVFVDGLRWFVLGRFAANLVALGVAIYPLLDFMNKTNEGQLMSIAQLLVHLQVVLLLERKTPRIYWQLFVLSVLQVVVASALKFDLSGGATFLLYVAAAFAAMILMLVHRDADRLTEAARSASRRQEEVQRALQGEKAVAALRASPIAVFDRPTSDQRLAHSWFKKGIAATGAAVVFAAFLFYSIPRTGEPWFGARLSKLSMVGFTQQLTFDEEGVIPESAEQVMRVWYLDPKTGQAMNVGDSLYLRGTTLHHYTIEGGRPTWKLRQKGESDFLIASQMVVPELPADDSDYLLQRISMEPSGERFLFTAFPAYSLERDRRLSFDVDRNVISQARDPSSNEVFRYELAVKGLRGPNPMSAWPYRSPDPQARTSTPMGSLQQRQLLQMPSEIAGPRFSTLRELARQWSANFSLESQRIQAARALEARLRYSGDFQYTLDFSNLKRDPSLDPIEDFVRNHRQGHCEYFAATLTLMLRSLGIPARLVVGYRGGEFNSIGGFYDVAQRDAHVWVEAYLAPQDVNEEMIRSGEAGVSGAWLQLDPTPAARDAIDVAANDPSLRAQAGQAFGYAQMLWDDFVVGLDAERQSRTLGKGFGDLFNADYWGGMVETALSDIPWVRETRREWLQGGVIAVGLVVLAGLFWSRRSAFRGLARRRWLRRLAPKLAQWLSRLGGERRQTKIAFFERFERLAEQHGIQRAAATTARELAEQVMAHHADHPQASQIAEAARGIASAFERVRYGEAALDETASMAVNAALGVIERAWQPSTA